MKNTQIYLWLEPMIMNHSKCFERVYFNCVIEGDFSKKTISEIEDLLEGEIMQNIMNFANIDINYNYGVISSTVIDKNICIEYAISPEKKKQEEKLSKIIENEKSINLSKKDVKIEKDGIINIKVPNTDIKKQLDFSKIWESIEKNIIGSIQEDDTIVFIDKFGNEIFEILGGSFLDISYADMKILDSSEADINGSFFSRLKGLKGGVYVREDGSLDVGDFERTFYLKIFTNNLLKTSLKLNIPINKMITENIKK